MSLWEDIRNTGTSVATLGFKPMIWSAELAGAVATDLMGATAKINRPAPPQVKTAQELIDEASVANKEKTKKQYESLLGTSSTAAGGVKGAITPYGKQDWSLLG